MGHLERMAGTSGTLKTIYENFSNSIAGFDEKILWSELFRKMPYQAFPQDSSVKDSNIPIDSCACNVTLLNLASPSGNGS